ncbi:hypothetical protein F5Y17DRAFT_306164 [Xylariaceae sp. FL0594]|nr:hypothetical protein F5Y17DRAFT_306164 [Xylariaceae sp. FL0594]
MQFSFFKAAALAAVLSTTSAAPLNGRSDGDVVATTTTSEGQIIDWIKPESQVGDGKIATPPPAPFSKRSYNSKQPSIHAILGNDPGKQGPNGTVPRVRASKAAKPNKRLPSKDDHNKLLKTASAQDGYSGQHWYASSGQNVNNHGGKATFSLFKAFVQSDGDFSLLQTAVIRNNAAQAGSSAKSQTVEAGWINFPGQIQAPHLFTYFTTDGYNSNADNKGGWNTEVKGWVQVDSSITPGIAFAPLSTDGGDQYELEIGYYLSGGNWWLWCLDRFVGYYPASLFSQGVNAADTLADHSDIIDFYGEIYNSETSLTTTDMGSGEFPQAGFGKSAYLHNIYYIDQGSNNYVDYNGDNQLVVSDTSRYNLIKSWNSGTSWGSYFYLGGPGAGGRIGA